MTSSVDLFPPRRPLFFPVVIATVFLTIIGMTAGYVLGERHRRSHSAAQAPNQLSGTTNVVSAAPTISVSGPSCPDPAQQAAAVFGTGNLRQIFKIITDKTTTVWICEDPQGALFYQSHTLLDGKDLPLEQNRNGLFLPGVTHSSSGFEVIDQKGNRFEIGRDKLRLFFADGRVQSDNVAKVEG